MERERLTVLDGGQTAPDEDQEPMPSDLKRYLEPGYGYSHVAFEYTGNKNDDNMEVSAMSDNKYDLFMQDIKDSLREREERAQSRENKLEERFTRDLEIYREEGKEREERFMKKAEEIQGDFNQQRSDVQNDVNHVRNDMNQLRNDVRNDVKEMRGDIKSSNIQIQQLVSSNNKHNVATTWAVLGIAVATSVTIIVAMFIS